ncbi:hypothetical protein FSW04_03695 [Baekduia soli]|uniref:Uncharacterized protein n=1 Tax=Baekduia soli TaxID=496014 RepID=A0A5B8U195_9ACTN|nr:hypothetical protein [Baekduia soli]QEC46776.1 hypothetical protein FSW04_03695 [Baekduia soli]
MRQEGGLLASALYPRPAGPTPYGDLVAHGPRAVAHRADLPLVVEAVREGFLLHHGEPGLSRIMGRDDDDLALLAGDRLYALGLELLAAAGDLEAVQALADVIALGAQACAADDAGLAEAVWAAGCAEIGWGPDPALEMAKDAARAGISGAAERLGAAARHISGDLAPPR